MYTILRCGNKYDNIREVFESSYRENIFYEKFVIKHYYTLHCEFVNRVEWSWSR